MGTVHQVGACWFHLSKSSRQRESPSVLRIRSHSPMPETLHSCDVIRARVTGDHQIAIKFQDGLVAELNLEKWLMNQHGPAVEPLKSPVFFAYMDIEDGVLTWPNGFDLDPVTVRHWAEDGI